MKIILTGATGMAGEGVLFECLENSIITNILIAGRKPYGLKHPKVKELIVPDFLELEKFAAEIKGYDACFFCAGISSVGMGEEAYTPVTHTTTLAFARVLLSQNPEMVFNYITGSGTDSTGKSRQMWARVKGKTENDLMQLGFKGQYNFRPALMLPAARQKNVKWIHKVLIAVLKHVLITLKQLAAAMINVTQNGYPKQVLEVQDIKAAAVSQP